MERSILPLSLVLASASRSIAAAAEMSHDERSSCYLYDVLLGSGKREPTEAGDGNHRGSAPTRNDYGSTLQAATCIRYMQGARDKATTTARP